MQSERYPRKIMVVTPGAKPVRVAQNVAGTKPDLLIVLEQNNPGWSRSNAEYKEVLELFYKHPAISELTREQLEVRYVTSLTEAFPLYDTLYWIFNDFKGATEIIVDITAMPREAESVALEVAGYFTNTKCIASGKEGYGRYSRSTYPNPEARGSEKIIEIPLVHRDIRSLKDLNSELRLVFMTLYYENQRHIKQRKTATRPFEATPRALLEILKRKRPDMTELSLSKYLANLKKIGLVIERSDNSLALHELAYKLGEVLDEFEPLKFEDRNLIEKFVVANEAIIRSLASKFKTYRYMSEERIASWLLQFPTRLSAETALKFLQEVEYIDDVVICECLQTFCRQNPEITRAGSWIGLMGRLADSTVLVTNALTHSTGGLEGQVDQVPRILAQKDLQDLYIFDDSIITGSQAKDIFSEWLGLSDRGKYVEKLDDTKISRLKSFVVKLHVIIGSEEGVREVQQFLRAQGLNVEVTHSRSIERRTHSAFTQDRFFANSGHMESARNEFRRIGMKLLSRRAHFDGWTRQQIETNALGYNDWQLLVIFQHNTPSSALPVFWEEGYLDGREWKPLFPRRPALDS